MLITDYSAQICCLVLNLSVIALRHIHYVGRSVGPVCVDGTGADDIYQCP